DLVLHTAAGDVVEKAPVLYQNIGGVHQAVAGRFVLQNGGMVGFAVGAYDHSQPLTIDPVLSYSTFLGGNGMDGAFGIPGDASGNAYVVGRTLSTNLQTATPAQAGNGGAKDAFVAKVNSSGTGFVYVSYLGGSGNDEALSVAVDSAGDAFVTGDTRSTNFPV